MPAAPAGCLFLGQNEASVRCALPGKAKSEIVRGAGTFVYQDERADLSSLVPLPEDAAEPGVSGDSHGFRPEA